MATLTIRVADEFELVFTSSKWGDALASAEGCKASGTEPHALYRVSDAAATLTLENDKGESRPLAVDDRHQGTPFFFDNVDYDVWLSLCDGCSNCRIESESKAGEKEFTRHGNVLTAGINFENDIGRFDFSFSYEKHGSPKRFTLVGEVLSQKLDYHHDWEVIFNEIDAKYPLLAADYLKRTYHSFDYDPRADDETTPGLIWWNLFRSEKEKLLTGARLIVERPRRRLSRVEDRVRADRLTALTPRLENELAEHRAEVGCRYRVERDSSTHDTVENRFVKHALGKVLNLYENLCRRVQREYGDRLSDSAREKMAEDAAEFRRLLAHPFFRGIGAFTGFRQDSLVLRQAPGYSAVARSFAILHASHMLYDGTRRLETKNIAVMYEIWCFLKLENIITESCKSGGMDVEVEENYRMLDERFVQNLGAGVESQVVFRTRGENPVELARLVYNPDITRKPRPKTGLPDLRVPTGLTGSSSQAPDFVLRLTKSYMGKDDFKITYLFDAKYRVAEKAQGAAYSSPPQDAIDQMHRYRDAIYYSETGPAAHEKLKKEVIGGYILFPGDGVIEAKPAAGQEDRRPEYLKSIDSVNIGAFPIKPGNAADVTRLEGFVQELLTRKADDHLLGTPSQEQKGTERVREGTGDPARTVQIVRYHGGLSKELIEAEGIFPCETAICPNPANVKMLVFPHVRDGKAFVPTGSFEGPVFLAQFKKDHPAFSEVKFQTEEIYYWQVRTVS